MILRTYWQFFKRRWLLIVIPAMVVALLGMRSYQPPGSFFTVGVRFLVGQTPSDAAKTEDEERLANWQASEYIVNGITDWVNGTLFAERVSIELASQGIDIPTSEIWGQLVADNTRSMLTVAANNGNREHLEQIIGAAIIVLTEENGEGIPQLGGVSAEIVPLDTPIINEIHAPITNQLDLPLRLFVALITGLSLATLVEYLDQTIHTREDVEKMQIPVLGEVPKK